MMDWVVFRKEFDLEFMFACLVAYLRIHLFPDGLTGRFLTRACQARPKFFFLGERQAEVPQMVCWAVVKTVWNPVQREPPSSRLAVGCPPDGPHPLVTDPVKTERPRHRVVQPEEQAAHAAVNTDPARSTDASLSSPPQPKTLVESTTRPAWSVSAPPNP